MSPVSRRRERFSDSRETDTKNGKYNINRDESFLRFSVPFEYQRNILGVAIVSGSIVFRFASIVVLSPG